MLSSVGDTVISDTYEKRRLSENCIIFYINIAIIDRLIFVFITPKQAHLLWGYLIGRKSIMWTIPWKCDHSNKLQNDYYIESCKYH